MPATIQGYVGTRGDQGNVGELFFQDGKAYRLVINNESTTALANGDVVVYDPASTNGSSVKLTTTANSLAYAGVVVDAVPAGMVGRVQVVGEHSAVKVDATVAIVIGDALGTHTTSTRGAKTTTANARFGVAQTALAAGTGTIRVLLRTL